MTAPQATTLFPAEPEALPAPHPGPFAAVALEDSLDKLLDYAVPPRLEAALKIAQRVRVPLGRNNRPAYGYVVAINPTTAYPRIKTLLSIDDERVLLTPALMDLSRWMSRYYCAPLGAVIESVIPSAVKKKTGVGYLQIVRLAKGRGEMQALLEKTKAPKRRAILARLLLLEPDQPIELHRLAGEAGATPATVRKLAKFGWITVAQEVDMPGLTAGLRPSAGDEPDIALNEDQRKVFDALRPRVAGEGAQAGFSVNLVQGVTGSGKTEVYLQCIREVVKRGRQAIVLVPEIALTPQTVRRFTARFKSVAVLHSGLTATQRHRFWQQIAQGQADVVVGARSAVFAPLANLGCIVVDEEHESSYKQDSAPRYHGRDVAIKRGQIENVPVILGSATPSLEMFWRVMAAAPPVSSTIGSTAPSDPLRDAAVTGAPAPLHPAKNGSEMPRARPAPPLPGAVPAGASAESKADDAALPSAYQLLSLPRRVRGLSMPQVELVDMKQEARFRRGVHLLSQRLEHLLRTAVEAGRQAILLLNRRGYSNFVYCVSCQSAIQCKFCDATMTYHRSADTHVASARAAQAVHTGQLHCHYCLAIQSLPEICPQCRKKLSLFGLGTQRVEEELARKFPALTFARVDSDTMRGSKDYEALLDRFAKGDLQVMLGTQMIAKGLDYPNVTLVGVISGDTALALPDFRAAERTFQLITQVAGRAGRGDNPGRVVLQTFLPDDPTIRAALRQDFEGFARAELATRKEVGLPPFGRMVRIVLRDQDLAKLHERSEVLAADVNDAVAGVKNSGGDVRMKGPMPCAVNRIAGYYRNQIVLQSPRADPLQRVLWSLRSAGALARGERIAVDVDPVSLL